jgi:hypothetical protein
VSFSCVKHPMTLAQHICGECGHQFCPECVVFPFGMTKPPACIACALELAGVRRQATGRPKLTRKSIKRRLAMQRPISTAVHPPVAEEPAPTPAAEAAPGAPVAHDVTASVDGGVGEPDNTGSWRHTYE